MLTDMLAEDPHRRSSANGRCARVTQVNAQVTRVEQKTEPASPSTRPAPSCVSDTAADHDRTVPRARAAKPRVQPHRAPGRRGEPGELRLDVQRDRRRGQRPGGTVPSGYDTSGRRGASGENARFGARGE
ncbi:hypothetical protein JCM9533A_22780 [Catenuloplanes niger JCM 9533]